MEMIKPAHHSIRDTISELAAALTAKAKWPGLPGMMAFSESSNPSCNAVGKQVVEDLVEIADISSSFFKTYLANFVQALFAIARASESKDGVRQMAVEVLLCIVEEKDLRTCLNITEFASDLVRVLLELKLKVTTRDYDVSKKGLNRVASNIRKDIMKNVIFGCISEYSKGAAWQYKLVLTVAIESLCSLHEETDSLLDELVEILEAQLKNSQCPLVRSATCKAIGQLAENDGFQFEESYSKATLPLLVDMFDDPVSSVQCEAVAVFIMIAGETNSSVVTPFADQVMDKLLKRITPENPRMTRERCIEGVAAVASVIEKEFMKYYPVVVPLIKGIIIESSTKEERAIRGEAVKCFYTISESVGTEKIQADSHEVMQAVLHVTSADLWMDDPLKVQLQKTFRRMCLALKGEFLRYFPYLIPNILEVLDIEPQPDNHEEDDEEVIAIVADAKSTELTDSENQEDFEAIDLLSPLIEVLGFQLGEYLVPAAQSLLSLLSLP